MRVRLGNKPLHKILLFMVCTGIIGGCVGLKEQSKPAPVPEIRPGILAGYLQPEELPNSLALLPAPPVEGSIAFALDEEVSQKTFALRGTLRWELAAKDANLMFPEAASTFSCAMGAPITEQDMPHLYMLLRRTLADAGLSTYAAKKHYQRQRPFMVNDQPICTPNEEDHLREDGSYPSGHTALGWAWALILAEIAPERADEILARGRTFGESRNVCNVHWHSDVVAGRFMGAAVVARLHANPAFQAELDAAKAELDAVRAKGLRPTRDCQAETDALSKQKQIRDGETNILKSWQGDYPVAQLKLLPEKQRNQAVGFITNDKDFRAVWQAFKPGQTVPQLDFETNFVLFTRNTQFYNRISIGKVKLKNGVAEVLAMETMSAIPIEDKVAMSMAVISRQGITSIQTPEGPIVISNQDNPQTFVYECGDGYSFTARVGEKNAWLFLPNQSVNLPLVSSDSDSKYSQGLIVYRAKGDKAVIEVGGNRHADCFNNRAKAIWEGAKLRGVDYRARGNEPGWHLEISKGDKIVFVADYGNNVYTFVAPQPVVNQDARKTIYKVLDDQHIMEVLIEGRPCSDTMSGEPFDTTATVILDSKKYRGCGMALH